MSGTYRHLKAWTYPRDYMGATWYQWAAVCGQHRDSSALERSNYRTIFADLQKRFGKTVVTDTRASHWAVGWVETIYVRTLCKPAMEAADAWLEALQDYPVADDSDFSELECEEAEAYWKTEPVSERVRIIREHGQGECNVFAARRDYVPRDGGVWEYLTAH